MVSPKNFAVVLVFLLLEIIRVSDGSWSCLDDDPFFIYHNGSMDCKRPTWTAGQHLHEIRFPSRDPKGYFVMDSNKEVPYRHCPRGRCFNFSSQRCVRPRYWRSVCKPPHLQSCGNKIIGDNHCPLDDGWIHPYCISFSDKYFTGGKCPKGNCVWFNSKNGEDVFLCHQSYSTSSTTESIVE